MMYNAKLVASLKANGKVLREFKDTVYIPFASEYSILLKNLNTVRALVNIYIDGENVTPNGLVLNAGQEVDFERSLANGSLTEGNKFKFIERTGAVEQHRGVKLEDGIVRIEYQFEKVFPKSSNLTWTSQTWSPTTMDSYYGGILRSQNSTSPVGSSMNAMRGTITASSADMAYTSMPADAVATATYNDAGITVAGSKSEQKFTTVSNFTTETEKHTIVLRLLGETPDNKPVVQAVTTSHKPKCPTCGKLNKATAKFCIECGTSLEIFA
jgi:hypothetical protein